MFRKLGFGKKKQKEREEASQGPVSAEDSVQDIGAGPNALVRTVKSGQALPSRSKREEEESFFSRLVQGLAKTRKSFISNLRSVLRGRAIDGALLEDLEEVMITADMGMPTTSRIMERVREKASERSLKRAEDIIGLIKESMLESLEKASAPSFMQGIGAGPNPAEGGGRQGRTGKPYSPAQKDADGEDPTIIMVVGVNGVGKTTTIGKLAHRLKQGGKKVMLAAADTFRAAAIEQLEVWATRAGADIIKGRSGGDPSAVIYDSIQAARARGYDIIIADTAGRLHTKVNLMEELKKVKRVVNREVEGAPHEVLLVLDATTGQNAFSQARMFHEALGITGIALTKLDGTAKGGVVIGIVSELGIPLKFIGIGEKVDDLRPFDPAEFVEALFQDA